MRLITPTSESDHFGGCYIHLNAVPEGDSPRSSSAHTVAYIAFYRVGQAATERGSGDARCLGTGIGFTLPRYAGDRLVRDHDDHLPALRPRSRRTSPAPECQPHPSTIVRPSSTSPLSGRLPDDGASDRRGGRQVVAGRVGSRLASAEHPARDGAGAAGRRGPVLMTALGSRCRPGRRSP